MYGGESKIADGENAQRRMDKELKEIWRRKA